MAHKVKSNLDVEGYLTAKSRLFVEDALYDNTNSTGSSGQVLSKDATGQVVWATPAGSSGIDGTGTANKIAFFTDADTIDDTTLHWDSLNSRLGIGATSPTYPLDIQSEASMGGGTLYYDHTGKKIGINTTSPSEKLDVNGTIRLRGALKDGGNGAGTSGQVLKSTGTATDWVDPIDLAYKVAKTYYISVTGGSSGTFYLQHHGDDVTFSLNYESLFPVPSAGSLEKVSIVSSASYSGTTWSLINSSGSNIWTSGSINLTGNTTYQLTPSSATFSATDKIGFKLVRGTSPFTLKIAVTAIFAFE